MTEQTQIESIGGRLHRARLKKKVTIDQVYKDIKIHPKILTAIEEDRYETFLNPTYIKAFVKSYCRYLEIDANKILADYDALQKDQPKQQSIFRKENKPSVHINVDWQKYIKLGKKWLLPILAGVIAVFLIISTISLTSKAVRKIKTIKLFKPRPAATAAKESKEPAIIKPLSIPAGQPLTLIVKTKGDVWLEVNADGKTVFKSVLKKGSVEAYKANEGFKLWTGKGEYLDLVLNGNSIGSPGNGVIKNILLTREGLAINKK